MGRSINTVGAFRTLPRPVLFFLFLFILSSSFFSFFLQAGISGRLTWVKAIAAARAALYPVLQGHAGSFRVSEIHRTMTWTRPDMTAVDRVLKAKYLSI